jgi:hypothetical protein
MQLLFGLSLPQKNPANTRPLVPSTATSHVEKCADGMLWICGEMVWMV